MFVRPCVHRVAAQAITMNAATRFVSVAPIAMSSREPASCGGLEALVHDVALDEGLAPRRDRCPDGADDCQQVGRGQEVAVRDDEGDGGATPVRPGEEGADRVRDRDADCRPRRKATGRARTRSGRAGAPSPRRRSPRSAGPARRSRLRAAPMPANSATVSPRLAASIVRTAKAAQRTPNRSRIRPDRPCPVARPMRAPTSWVKKSATWLARRTHSRS